MKKLLRLFTILIATLSSLFTPCSTKNVQQTPGVNFKSTRKFDIVKQIYYLSSYSLDWFSVADQINGFLNGLDVEAKVDYNFLDAHNNLLKDPVIKSRQITAIQDSTQFKHYDLIVVADDEALQFLNEAYLLIPAFENVPVLFHGINYNYNAKRALENDNYYYINGITEAENFEELLRTASDLIPNAKKVNLIYENTYIGSEEVGRFKTDYNKLVKEGYGNFKHMEEPNYIIANSLSRIQLADVINYLPRNEINIFTFLSTDVYNNPYDYRDIVKLFLNNSYAPIFTMNDFGIGKCFVGGSVYSHYLGGQKVGEWANEILVRGVDYFRSAHPATEIGIYVPQDELLQIKYDGVLLNKYDLDYTRIPRTSRTVILNEQEVLSFFSQYRDIIIPSIIGLSLLFAAGIWILWLYGKEREKNKIIVTERRKLEYLASHDFLTGLRSRQHFSTDLNNEFEKQEPFFLIAMDIDGFKYINDTYGHLVGDKVLVRCSKYFKEICRDKNYYVYRVGGDEFIFLLKTNQKQDVIDFINLIKEDSISNFSYKDHEVELTYSMGVAQYPYDGTNEVDLVGSADSALYYIKENGKNNYAFYDRSSHDSLAEIGAIERELRDALNNDGLTLEYQPQVDIDTGEVLAYEAFVRFKSKKFSTKNVISFAEKNGFIIDIGKFVLKEAAYFLERMRKRFGYMKPVSVNFSFSQLKDKDFLEEYKNMMFEMDIPLNLIMFEVSEHGLRTLPDSYDYFMDFVEKNEMNVILDRFGSSLSSINLLQSDRLTTVKFDINIIKTLIDKPVSPESFNAIVKFLHTFNVDVCAVGVERDEQVKKLREAGCDSIQGFLVQKPQSEEMVFKNIKKVYKLK